MLYLYDYMLHADCMRMCIYACISIAASQRIGMCCSWGVCTVHMRSSSSAIPYLLYKCAKVPTQHSSSVSLNRSHRLSLITSFN